jgi:cephalosporin-C deacetylase-like acetyl esterase
MKTKLLYFLLGTVLTASAAGSYFYFAQPQRTSLSNPFSTESTKPTPKPLPLNQYTLPNLKHYPYQASKITITKQLQQTDDFTTYAFTYQTMHKTMSGTVNIPALTRSDVKTPYPVIIMIRGYAAPAQFFPGFGTHKAAAVFAKNGYVTIAPNFFGFGESDAEPEDSWEARFIKPINVIELIYSLQKNPEFQFDLEDSDATEAAPKLNTLKLAVNPSQLGIWAHSNGGQIAISVLEIMSQPIPTAVWAPVTAPFPYSILFFTRNNPDEGKESRAWLAMFEKDYDVFEFSITQHLDKLTGPIQIHHGSNDQDALQIWSDEFVNSLKTENEKRSEQLKTENKNSTQAAQLDQDNFQNNLINSLTPSELIDFTYFTYPGADHNLQPIENWTLAIERDLKFFEQHLLNTND